LEVSDVRVSSNTNERRIYVMIALVFFVGLFAYRVALFSDIEPRSDQAFFYGGFKGWPKQIMCSQYLELIKAS
jgi:hypothetical protein